MAGLVLKGIKKSFGDVKILHGIDLEIQDGEFVVFVGPSGCGKSTLLRCIAGLEDITGGELFIGGRQVQDEPPSKRGIAMVFQSYALYPHMSVEENMAFALKLANVSKEETKAAVDRAAKILQIQHMLHRKPKELSGGQRQRVAIGRAIVRKPEVFLFDEPLSNLDAALRVQMRVELSKLHQELKSTMIYVTHDQVEAMTLANRIVVLSAGRIEQVGAPLELYHRPANLFVAGFIGSPKMNFLAGQLVEADEKCASIKLKGGAVVKAAVDARKIKPGSDVTFGVRPEHVSLDVESGDCPLAGRMQVIERLGDTTYFYLEIPGSDIPFVVRAVGDKHGKIGENIVVGTPVQRSYVFDSEGHACPVVW